MEQRIRATARKAVGGRPPAVVPWADNVWHPLLITAADQGGRQRVFAGLAAKEERVGSKLYRVSRGGEFRHPDGSGAPPSAAEDVSPGLSPFPLSSYFGLLPYATFHGHVRVVESLCAADFSLSRTGLVSGSCPCLWVHAGAGTRPPPVHLPALPAHTSLPSTPTPTL